MSNVDERRRLRSSSGNFREPPDSGRFSFWESKRRVGNGRIGDVPVRSVSPPRRFADSSTAKRPSRFPFLRCIRRTALCCCTTHDDGTPFEQHRRLLCPLSRLSGQELARHARRKSLAAMADLPYDSSRLDVRSLADRFGRPREKQYPAQPLEPRASDNEPLLQRLPAPKPALDFLYQTAPCSASVIFLRAQRGAPLKNRKRFASFAR